ncbi:MerR family transcriptional regulator [Mycobacterium sp. 1274761.0]|uniref:MerR family transcriptional regulator n=1 Tax=Mycobacterium sp. 1274761.0 TaxID=1834077 RepID=UPI0007FFFBA9|nr:MerR family transcriptional regulator [Mycobacterium sp. 1274761.0]OBK74104.1 transcriptional regulator [Mycobacterium sp. 1274761.0]
MPDRDDADVPRYTVSVVAERVGVPTATLRSWNQRYGVGPTDHSPGRHRLYSDNDIAIVEEMHELIAQGASPRSAARTALESIKPRSGDQYALLAAVFELDVGTVSRLLDRHIRHLGVVATWEDFIRPAFAAIEARQADGEGCIDVEHALSWSVSRSLQAVPLAKAEASESIILACTSGEAHCLPLEALRAALAERGQQALMLGPDVPTDALLDAISRQRNPVAVVLWSQSQRTADLATAKAVLGADAQLVVGGSGWASARLPKKVEPLEDLRTALHRLEVC